MGCCFVARGKIKAVGGEDVRLLGMGAGEAVNGVNRLDSKQWESRDVTELFEGDESSNAEEHSDAVRLERHDVVQSP